MLKCLSNVVCYIISLWISFFVFLACTVAIGTAFLDIIADHKMDWKTDLLIMIGGCFLCAATYRGMDWADRKIWGRFQGKGGSLQEEEGAYVAISAKPDLIL